MRSVDLYRARLIIARLDESGDTPAARLIEGLLREQESVARPDTRIGPGVQRASRTYPSAEVERLRVALRDAIRALENGIPRGGDFIGDLRRELERGEDQ